jgi:chorismate synthase
VSNSFGERFRVTTFGESHGPAVGCVVDGCPAGLPLAEEHIATALERDVPIPAIGTPRREPNRPQILSGLLDGLTLGTPIAIVISNEDSNSEHYEPLRNIPRPGHAELTYLARYGRIDWRGGGRASGRECIARLAAGAVARRLLATRKVHVRARVEELADIEIGSPEDLDRAVKRVRELGEKGESTGGVVRLRARGIPAGLGAPVFEKLSARLAHALLGIGGVKALEFGDGVEASALTGSRHNDPIVLRGEEVVPETNRAGGMLGGMATGLPLEVRLWVKPTPSVGVEQKSVDLATLEPVELKVEGRFDLNITPRVGVVAEAMTCLVLADAMLEAGQIHPTRLDSDAAEEAP